MPPRKFTPDQRRQSRLLQNLARNILYVMRQQKLTLEDVAERSGVAVSTLSNIFNLEVNPTLLTVESVAAALEVSPFQMLLDGFEPWSEVRPIPGARDFEVERVGSRRRLVRRTPPEPAEPEAGNLDIPHDFPFEI